MLFSAYAEVFLGRAMGLSKRRSFLCLRRGVSGTEVAVLVALAFSLPTQRCFSGGQRGHCLPQLFSAYAEVFPAFLTHSQAGISFLCLRRGVSPSRFILPGL